MSFYDDEQKRLKEEAKHAKIGGCVASILLLIIVPAVCWILMTFTNGGNIIQAHTMAYYTFRGIPVTKYTSGISDIAKQACELDKTTPPNYQQEHELLSRLYETKVKQYQTYWNKLQLLNQDTSRYEEPEQIPGNLASAKFYYCTR